ncbi:MAG: hypothetical protein DRP12_02540 [Candidatus Aenigmatarchaeota archaeon]|nr:MAG: hypothetical protein DRP12_02540 [Candidatus Aenigmarchaeota archaeon]
MERIRSGIPGLDKLLKGGIPKNQIILLTGTSGTGKTIFCSQYLWTGAKKWKEPGVYLSFEEPAEKIKESAKNFGWDFNKLEKKGMISFMRYDPYRIEDVIDILESTVREINAKRVAIDSISALGLYVKDRAELRRLIFDLSFLLRRLGCTTILVSEIVPGSKGLSRYGVEEFVADSVIVLYYERLESQFIRAIQIWKLRGSSHSQKIHPYRIGRAGITVLPEEEAFIQK